MNNIAYFEIQASDPEAAMRFYGAVFGWRFVKEADFPMDYWQIKSDGINGGLMERFASAAPPGVSANAFVCSVQVADFDATAEKIIHHGGQTALEKFPVPGRCWQGYFVDTEQNTFGVFQVDETAA